MSSLVRTVVCVVLISWLAGCASAPERPLTYRVREGDTLYRIAARYNLDYRQVARWNNIGRGYVIYPGQVLRLAPGGTRVPSAARTENAPVQGARSSKSVRSATPVIPAGPPVNWQWPAQTRSFKRTERPNGGLGLTFEGSLQDAIHAAGDGRVVYTGSGLMGYGQLVIVKHNEAYLSAYGHTASLQVKEGDVVKSGQRIATMGAGLNGRPMLYFEIRANGKPVDPLTYLPRR